ncbi:MAG: VPS10 domain-containing protein [Terriglobia bacterium]
MKILRRYLAFLFLAALAIPACAMAAAPDTGAAQSKGPFVNLEFRNLGPAIAGGRVSAVEGIPRNPAIYYVGAAAGGVFKTTDGGATWKAIFTKQRSASIGAIAIAPSNPNYVWVGTGEANIRNDVIDGDGIYFSPDAGHTWKFMGLGDAGQISRIIVDPANPDVVFAGVLGHPWAPNVDRGVFRTTDGGKTWKKVLFVDASTGVSDLVMQPGNPKALYAGMWEARRYPWTMVNGGASSGIYRTTDGGDTWTKLTKGLPTGDVGRIALAVAPSNPSHVYALVTTKDNLLWQSTDSGDTWTEISDNHALDVRPFYFSHLVVSPTDENKLYFLSFYLMESDDGGKTAHPIDHGVHVDHHAIWIDPKNPSRMIQGNDGGAFLSMNAGKTWRFLHNLPIEQFYQVAVDSSQPFTVCGGLQDNSAWCGVSSDLGRHGVTGATWYTVQGGDGEYAVPAPSDADVIYADAQEGYIARFDKRTHLSPSIRPYLNFAEMTKPADLKYRFNWTSPIAVSATDANEVYLGANVVFKSTDGGKSWTPISPDLTRNDKAKQEIAGGPILHDISSAENYDTILCITIAPTDPKVLWVGTDDGLVQVTRDGGKSWTNVAPNIPGAPSWSRVYQIGVSPFEAGTAYVAFDAHMLDDRRPYVYKTSNYGLTWEKITNGLPANSPVHVVREDPNQRGLLVLGAGTGLFYSTDDGGHWTPLKANFPVVPVFDLKFTKRQRDLVVATHGRGIFVLDDIRPVEEYRPTMAMSSFHLFTPGAGAMFHHWDSDEGQRIGYMAPNAPDGVAVDYLLKSEIKPSKQQKQDRQTPVKIIVTDAHGNTVATQYGPSKAGINRFVWNMRYDGARKLRYEAVSQPEPGEPNPSRGPRALPGTYHIAVTVGGQTQSQTVEVAPDPNLKIPPADFMAQAKAALQARNELSALDAIINRIDEIENQLKDFENNIEGGHDPHLESRYASILSQAKALGAKLGAAKHNVWNTAQQHNVEEDDIHQLEDLHGQFADLSYNLSDPYGEPPTQLLLDQMARLRLKLDQQIKDFNALLSTSVAAYNKSAHAASAPTVFAGEPVTVEPVKLGQ